MRPEYRQAGFIVSMEVVVFSVPVLVLLFVLYDLSRVVNHRSQVEAAAFSLVSMVANRSGYQQRYKPDTPASGDPMFLELDMREAAEQLDELRGLQTAADQMLPDADIGLVVWQVNELAPAGLRLGNGCPTGTLPVMDTRVYPVYVVWLCDRREWHWISQGLMGSLLGAAEGRHVARAIMPSRNGRTP